jgi:hypothetical protein
MINTGMINTDMIDNRHRRCVDRPLAKQGSAHP